MIAIAAFGIVLAVLLRTGGDLVRACLLAGLWLLPFMPAFAAWALVSRLLIVSGLVVDSRAGAVLSLLAGIGVAGSAGTLLSYLVFARQVPVRVALIGVGLSFGLIDIALAVVVNAVS